MTKQILLSCTSRSHNYMITINSPDKSKQKKIENIPEKILLWGEGHKTQDILYTQQHCQPRLVLGRCPVWISSGVWAMMTATLWFYLVPPGRFLDTTFIRPQPVPNHFQFNIHQSLYCQCCIVWNNSECFEMNYKKTVSCLC